MAPKDPLAPLNDDADPAPAAAGTTVPSPRPVVDSKDMAAHQSKFQRMKEALAKQPKVRIRVPNDTYVGLNGYGFWIKGKVSVEVPEQVAKVLEESGRI